MGAVVGAASLALMAVPVLAPSIARDLDLSPELIGFYSGAVWAAALLSSTLSGRLIDGLGAWQTSRACLILCALGVATAATGQPWGLLLSALLIGAGNGIEAPPASQVLAHHVPPARRPFFFSLKQTGVQLGAVCGSLLLPVLALGLGWRGALVGGALLVVLIAGALSIPQSRYGTPSAAGPAGRQSAPSGWWRSLSGRPALRRLAFAAAAFGATQVCLNSFIVTFLVQDRGLSLAHAGWIAALAQGSGLLGRLGWGWLASRHTASLTLLRSLGLAMSASALALGLYGATLHQAALLAIAAVFGLTASGWNGVFLAEVAARSEPAGVGATTGAVMVLMMTGLVAGPVAFATLAKWHSLGGAYVALSLVALGGSLLLPARAARM